MKNSGALQLLYFGCFKCFDSRDNASAANCYGEPALPVISKKLLQDSLGGDDGNNIPPDDSDMLTSSSSSLLINGSNSYDEDEATRYCRYQKDNKIIKR